MFLKPRKKQFVTSDWLKKPPLYSYLHTTTSTTKLFLILFCLLVFSTLSTFTFVLRSHVHTFKQSLQVFVHCGTTPKRTSSSLLPAFSNSSFEEHCLKFRLCENSDCLKGFQEMVVFSSSIPSLLLPYTTHIHCGTI